MMRRLLATTAVLCTISTGRSYIRTVRKDKLEIAPLFLFLLGCLGLVLVSVFFIFNRLQREKRLCTQHKAAIQVSLTTHRKQREDSCYLFVYVARLSFISYRRKHAHTPVCTTSWASCKENISREHHNCSSLSNLCDLSIPL